MRLGRRIVADGLVVYGRVMHVRPGGRRHGEPVPVALQAPFQHELGLVLLGRDHADDILVQPARQRVRLDVGDETVLVFAANQYLNVLCSG